MSIPLNHKQLLVELINLANPEHEWGVDELDFEAPQVSQHATLNTSLVVSTDTGPVGTQTVYYNRVDLSEVSSEPLVFEANLDNTSTRAVLAQIVDDLGVRIFPEDIDDMPVSYGDGRRYR